MVRSIVVHSESQCSIIIAVVNKITFAEEGGCNVLVALMRRHMAGSPGVIAECCGLAWRLNVGRTYNGTPACIELYKMVCLHFAEEEAQLMFVHAGATKELLQALQVRTSIRSVKYGVQDLHRLQVHMDDRVIVRRAAAALWLVAATRGKGLFCIHLGLFIDIMFCGLQTGAAPCWTRMGWPCCVQRAKCTAPAAMMAAQRA